MDVVDLLWFGNHLSENTNVVKIFELDKDRKYEQIIFLAGLSNELMAEFSPKNFIYNAALPSYLAYQSKAVLKIYICFGSIYGYTVDTL